MRFVRLRFGCLLIQNAAFLPSTEGAALRGIAMRPFFDGKAWPIVATPFLDFPHLRNSVKNNGVSLYAEIVPLGTWVGHSLFSGRKKALASALVAFVLPQCQGFSQFCFR